MNEAMWGNLLSLAVTLSQLALQWGVSEVELADRIEQAKLEGRPFGSDEDRAYFTAKRKAAIAALDAHIAEREAKETGGSG